MALIYTNQRSKPKRKPGWQKSAEEYQAWLKQVNSMTTGFSSKNRSKVKPQPKVTTSAGTTSTFIKKDITAFQGGGTKPVYRPEHTYADNPDMLERELKARERKFTTAPAYNKGGDVLVTDEMMKDIMSGATRRRN